MLSGHYKGQQIGSGTNTISMSEQLRAGEISLEEFHEAEQSMHRSQGHCMTMGTASTMACVVEALGVGMPGNAAIPAVDARRNLLAREAGRRIVEMVRQNMVLSQILTRQAFENAIRMLAGIGGSTNAVIHLLALAGRVGIDLKQDDFDALGRGVHCLVNLKPSGQFLMEDFFYAGGLPVVLRELAERGLLHKDAITANGKTIWDNVKTAEVWNREVIHSFDKPFKADAGMAILKGNLAPDGAVIKPSAASPHLMKHTGKAVVFPSIEDLHARINDDALEIDETSIMVLQNCGPKGYPAWPRSAICLAAKTAEKGREGYDPYLGRPHVGTAYGTVILHVAPEAAAGGPLGLVKTGDLITVDVAARSLHLHVDEAEMAARKKAWTPPAPPLHTERGYANLYVRTVLQADKGADLDFLVGKSGSAVPRDNH